MLLLWADYELRTFSKAGAAANFELLSSPLSAIT
jgi:hypothetical protein